VPGEIFFRGAARPAEMLGNYVGDRTLAYMRALRNRESDLSRDLKKGIGERLRATYENLVRQDLPARHVDLLQRLEPDKARPDTGLTKEAAEARNIWIQAPQKGVR
jgi:hypothetical protein